MVTMPDFIGHHPTSTVDAAVASLGQLGVAGERVQLVPVGPLESFRGEIVGQVPAPGAPLDDHDEITFYVSRGGIAERLPGALLEPLPTAQDEAKHAIEPGQSEDYWQRQVQAYGSGRRLVTVIDRALGRLHRAIGRLSWSLSCLSRDTSFARRALDLVHLGELPLSDEEQVLLSTILQRLPEWLGPAGGLVTMLEQFLGVPVTVQERPGPLLELPAAECRPLGTAQCRLGGALALGPRFHDSRPTIHVSVGPLPVAEFVALDRDPNWRAKVAALLAVCGPAACDTNFDLVLQASDRAACLGDPFGGKLGRTTYLGG